MEPSSIVAWNRVETLQDGDPVLHDIRGPRSMQTKGFCTVLRQVRLEAIHVPINMKNLQSASYLRTLWQRAVQSERHARGVVDFAYAVKQASCMPHINWTTCVLLLKVRAHFYPAIICQFNCVLKIGEA
jgi:hypothetical protein